MITPPKKALRWSWSSEETCRIVAGHKDARGHRPDHWQILGIGIMEGSDPPDFTSTNLSLWVGVEWIAKHYPRAWAAYVLGGRVFEITEEDKREEKDL